MVKIKIPTAASCGVFLSLLLSHPKTRQAPRVFNSIEAIKKELFDKNIYFDSAKLYAICIYLLVRNVEKNAKTLIICNDEDFRIIKKILVSLLNDYGFEIINITEFRKRLGRNVGSFADNYAKIYRKRGLNPRKNHLGKKINLIRISFNKIKQYWEELKENNL
ncbi:MAG: hypothetical protein ACOCUU_02110 [Nanoarchaeota archaeon]